MLNNKVAIVTGGVGGIGRAIVSRFLLEGTKVVIVDWQKNELESSVSEIKECGGSVYGVQADISSPKDVDTIVKQSMDHFGDVDILVNSAGVQGPIGSIFENDIEEWIRTIRVNLIGTFLCVKAVLPIMKKKKHGKIINFSGGGATSPRVRFSAYATSKAAVVRFTETLAEEMRPFNIQVNAVAPGAVNTRMLDEVLEAGREAAGREYEEAVRRKAEGGTSPELVAELVCYLASEDSDWLTGRLVSAVWDPWKAWKDGKIPPLSDQMFTLRRVDGRNILEKK